MVCSWWLLESFGFYTWLPLRLLLFLVPLFFQGFTAKTLSRDVALGRYQISNRFLCEPLRPSDFAVKFHWNLSASINHTSRFTSADSRCIISPRSGRGRWGFRRVTTIWSAAVHIYDSRLTIHVNWFHRQDAKSRCDAKTISNLKFKISNTHPRELLTL